MNWKLALVALFALLLAGLLYFVFQSPATTSGSVSGPITTEPVPADAERVPTQPELEVATSLRAEVEQAPGPMETKPIESQLLGTVVLTNEVGAELTFLSGEITLVLWKGNYGSHAKVPVRNGAFEVDGLDAESLSVDSLTLDGRGAALDDAGQRYAPTEAPLVVRAHWPKSVRVSVLSAATGQHLSGITIQRGEVSFFGTSEWQHPGRIDAKRALLTRGQSPLDLQPGTNDVERGSASYFVHSPGFAWKALAVDLTQGGEREVRLEPGGEVALLVTGELPRASCHLRLELDGAEDEAPFAELALRKPETLEITGLPVGTYLATIEIGKWYAEPLILAQTKFEIREGERTNASMALAALPNQEYARLAGTVRVPTAWGITEFTLLARFQGTLPDGSRGNFELHSRDMTRPPADDDSWAFEFPRLPIGTYQLRFQVAPMPGSVSGDWTVQLLPSGTAGVQLELPTPGVVVVHLIDSNTGELASIGQLSWNTTSTTSNGGRSSGSARRPSTETPLEFLAPIGQLALRTHDASYATLDETVLIGTGRNEFTFQLAPPNSVRFLFLDGETPVPLVDFYYPSPEHLDGDGKLQGATIGGGETFFSLTEPGRYVFEMPPIAGFEPIPPQTVNIVPGPRTEHVIQLVREG